jgi:exopolysaccharide biosynthesis protein
MLKYFTILFLFPSSVSFSQLKWQNADSAYKPLPASVHIFFTEDRIQDTAPFRAFYLIADLKNKRLDFTTDTTYKRRLTPKQFYGKDQMPLAVVNCSFFNFDQNKNLNLIVRDGKLIAYNSASLKGTGKDTIVYKIPFRSAIGIDKKRHADVAWTYTDSTCQYPMVSETVVKPEQSLPFEKMPLEEIILYKKSKKERLSKTFTKWNVQTAVGGGPVLLQNGEIFITNEEELMFTGKGINDKHPRTAMGYTKDNKLIILVVQGRSESGSGASLKDEAQILKDLGCIEALNLDGGGSSCLLVNGKETIKVSDKTGERPVPAVFLIKLTGHK